MFHEFFQFFNEKVLHKFAIFVGLVWLVPDTVIELGGLFSFVCELLKKFPLVFVI